MQGRTRSFLVGSKLLLYFLHVFRINFIIREIEYVLIKSWGITYIKDDKQKIELTLYVKVLIRNRLAIQGKNKG